LCCGRRIRKTGGTCGFAVRSEGSFDLGGKRAKQYRVSEFDAARRGFDESDAMVLFEDAGALNPRFLPRRVDGLAARCIPHPSIYGQHHQAVVASMRRSDILGG